MEHDTRGHTTHLAGVGALVAAWTFFDVLLMGVPILLLALVWRPLIVFIVGAIVWTVLNLAACRWIDRHWDARIGGSGFATKLDTLQNGKRARRAVAWIVRGSAFWFGVAAVLLSAGEVVALNRLVTGRPAGARQTRAASLAPPIVFVAVFSLVGVVLRQRLLAL